MHTSELRQGPELPGPIQSISDGRRLTRRDGLAVVGADGVRDVVEILRSELEGAMAMTGRTRLDDIDRSVPWKACDYLIAGICFGSRGSSVTPASNTPDWP